MLVFVSEVIVLDGQVVKERSNAIIYRELHLLERTIMVITHRFTGEIKGIIGRAISELMVVAEEQVGESDFLLIGVDVIIFRQVHRLELSFVITVENKTVSRAENSKNGICRKRK